MNMGHIFIFFLEYLFYQVGNVTMRRRIISQCLLFEKLALTGQSMTTDLREDYNWRQSIQDCPQDVFIDLVLEWTEISMSPLVLSSVQ